MPLWRFALLTTLGSGLWNAALIGTGWALGSNYEAIGEYIGPTSTALIALFGNDPPVSAGAGSAMPPGEAEA